MSQSKYNSLMSGLFNQKHTLAKLRAELEGKRERMCQCYNRLRHLACNCRNKKEEIKGKPILQNKFKVIASKVMQCRVREEVKVRRQKTIEKEKVRCFRC